MRKGCFIALAFLLTGCAAHPKNQQASLQADEPQLARYEESPASALVFDPPMPEGETPIELTRDERQPSAFVGFDGPITTSFWIYTQDWQDFGGHGLCSPGNGSGAGGGGSIGSNSHYTRDAEMVQSGVRTR
jgi:hypothetical protein